MPVSDEQAKIARAFGKRVFLIHRAGGKTLSQALNQAFVEINPDNRAIITAAIIASLVGVDLEDPPRRHRHRDAVRVSPDDMANVSNAEPPGPQPDPEPDDPTHG